MSRVNQRWKPSPAAMMLAGILTCVGPAEAAPIFSEGFDDVSALTGDGWVFTNNSSPHYCPDIYVNKSNWLAIWLSSNSRASPATN